MNNILTLRHPSSSQCIKLKGETVNNDKRKKFQINKKLMQGIHMLDTESKNPLIDFYCLSFFIITCS